MQIFSTSAKSFDRFSIDRNVADGLEAKNPSGGKLTMTRLNPKASPLAGDATTSPRKRNDEKVITARLLGSHLAK